MNKRRSFNATMSLFPRVRGRVAAANTILSELALETETRWRSERLLLVWPRNGPNVGAHFGAKPKKLLERHLGKTQIGERAPITSDIVADQTNKCGPADDRR